MWSFCVCAVVFECEGSQTDATLGDSVARLWRVGSGELCSMLPSTGRLAPVCCDAGGCVHRQPFWFSSVGRASTTV